MSQQTGTATSGRGTPPPAGTRTSSGEPVARVFFTNAPYIGALVRNALDAEKDGVELSKTGPGVEVVYAGRRYFVPWANVKCVEYA